MAEEFTTTGCVDCGKLEIMPKGDPSESSAIYIFGNLMVRIWRSLDNKHHIVLVKSRPERMFLTCQPREKLLNEGGVAAILNFCERIKPESEVK